MELHIKEFIATIGVGMIFVEIFKAAEDYRYAKVMKMAYVTLASVPLLKCIAEALDSSVILSIGNIIVNVFSILKTLAEKLFA